MELEADAIKRMVAAGYDKVSFVYRSDRDPATFETYRNWLRPILESLPPGADVLDLGCGCGVPASQILAEHFRVTGVDLSPVQIDRARRLLPRGRFFVDDMTSVSFPDDSFHAVVCLYALIHVPIAEQRFFLDSVHRWLRPQGLCLITVGDSSWTGTENNWLATQGATMYWSHADVKTYRLWFEEKGFSVIEETFVPEGNGGHRNFLLQKLRRSASSTGE